MRALTQADCLALWESGQALHPIDQGLLAVVAALPGSRSERVADWPLGRRNRALAELHCACFGPALGGWTACLQCGEKLEFEFDLGGKILTETGAQTATQCDAAGSLPISGHLFRLPTSRDLARIAGNPDLTDAAAQLLDLCLVAEEGGGPRPAWSERELNEIGERLAQADPLAEVLLDFECPVCGACFQEGLDLAAFFWSELEGRAKRLLLDVHTLAIAYGWSEAEVLALSPPRRNFYLEMVHA